MIVRRLFMLCALLVCNITLFFGQVYTGKGFANGEVDNNYSMPGTEISSDSGDEMNTDGVVTAYWFDVASSSGASLTGDKNVTYGIYPGSGSDAGGMDKRGYSSDNNTAYTPIRWNGGNNMFRQSGQWVRFTIDFEEGDYNFVYRGNINSYAASLHKFDLKIYRTSSLSNVLYSRVIDLTGSFPEEGGSEDNVVRIGGGNTDTDWFKVLDEITLASGTYVVEIGTPYNPFSHQPWGCFTFNKAASYDAIPYNGEPWIAGEDVVPAWQYDKVGDASLSFLKDEGVSVGVYGTATSSAGENIRSYTDNPAKGATRWNSTTNTLQSNGAWYNYTTRFEGKQTFFFKFRALPLIGQAVWEGTVRILEPITKHEILSFSFDDGVQYVSDEDEGETTRWMYINKPFIISEGTYLVQIDLPQVSSSGIMGEYCFVTEHPSSYVPQVVNYNWPSSIPKSEKYSAKVTLEGVEYELFPHLTLPDTRPSLYLDDNGGYGIPNFMTDRTLTFCQFAYTGEILVEVTRNFGTVADRVEIQPKAYGINPVSFDGRTVKFYLKHQPDKPSYISVNFISDDNLDEQGFNHTVPLHGMMLFGDKLEMYVPDKTDPSTVVYSESVTAAQVQNADIVYFPAGDYDLKDKFDSGVLKLTKNGQKVYAEGGAYIRGTVWSEGYDDIWLYGRGIFTGADYIFHELLDEDGNKEAYMNFKGSDNCHFEGFAITDPCHHSIPSGSNSYFKNMKIMGWSYNADGTRVGANSYMEELFMRTMDDRDYGDRQHMFKNSVLWPMRNGAFSMLGWGAYDGGKATYENLYFINSEWDRPEVSVGNQGVLGSKNIQGSNVSSDTLRNLFLEDYTTILTVLRHTYDSEEDFDPNDPGEFKDFLFDNIKVEHPFIKTSGEQVWQRIEGFEKDGVRSSVHDITFRNLVVAGELVLDNNKDKYFKIDDRFAYNIVFEASGDVHTIRAEGNSGGSLYPNGDIAVPDGTAQYVSIQPDQGYRIKNVKVDYQDVGRLQVVCLEDVTSDHVIDVEFELGDNVFDESSVADVNDILRNDIDLGVNHVSGINNIETNVPSLIVFPNPASSSITVKNVKENCALEVFNVYGQRIYLTLEHTIDVSGFDQGIYLLKQGSRLCKFTVK